MVGGIVIETIELEDRIWINCSDRRGQTCAIYVCKSAKSRCVSEGDSIWWHGPFALWTPAFNRGKPSKEIRANRDYDIKLDRLGCSGVSRPLKSPA